MTRPERPEATGDDRTPVLAAARALADRLAPRACARDAAGVVPPDVVADLKACGVLAVTGPARAGGADAPPAVAREVAETLAAADATVWFLYAQHASAVRALADHPGPAADRWLADLCTGRALGGVAFSHLRAHPRLPVVASERPDGSVRLDGTAPWFTGWGLSDVLALAAATPDGAQVVWCALQAGPRPGLVASPPMRLAALGASSTVALHLDGLEVAPEEVVHREPYVTWARQDARRTADAGPAVFGVARGALAVLRSARDAGAPAAADRLEARLSAARERCYALADADADPAERTAAKIAAQQLLRDATATAVAAHAGRAMDLAHPAQRLAREAMFLTVQAQTAPTRAAQLASFSVRDGAPVGG